MNNHKVKMFPVLLGLLMMPCWCSRAFAKAEAVVTFTYAMPPPSNPLPLDLQSIALLPPDAPATINTHVINWDRIVRGSLRRQLENYRDKYAQQLQIHDRADMATLDDETLRIESGTLGVDDGTAGMRQLSAEMLIESRFTCSIDRVVGHKEKLDLSRSALPWNPYRYWRYGYGYGYGLGGVGHRTVQEVAYNVTVACEFKILIPARGNESWQTYSGTLTNHEKTKSSIFLGIGSKSEAELEPVERVIQLMVDEHILAFLSSVIPMKGTEVAHVSTRSHGTKRKAVNALAAGNWRAAAGFASKVAKKHKDYDKAYFVLGLAREKLGKLKWAKSWYERAERSGHDPQYAQGVARINRRLAATAASESEPKPGPLARPQNNRSQDSRSTPPVHDDLSSPLDRSQSGSVRVSAKVSPELAAALRRAARGGPGNATQSERMEEIINSALRDWLEKHPQDPAGEEP